MAYSAKGEPYGRMPEPGRPTAKGVGIVRIAPGDIVAIKPRDGKANNHLGWGLWLGWVGVGRVEMREVGLGRVGLGWVELSWVGLGWVGLGWAHLLTTHYSLPTTHNSQLTTHYSLFTTSIYYSLIGNQCSELCTGCILLTTDNSSMPTRHAWSHLFAS